VGRYATVDIATYEQVAPDGTRRLVRYYRRRFPPDPATMPMLARHHVLPDDRLDLISARYTGDPFGFWRICDANTALDPDDLVDAEAVGTELDIPAPGVSS